MSLPAGTVTFLLTDVEDSARAWQERPEETSSAVAAIERLTAEAVTTNGGHVVKSRGEGDSMFCAFASASHAVAAATAVQLAIADQPLKVRIGIHTGDAELRDGDYYGVTPSKAARVRNVAVGRQILCSHATVAVLPDLPAGTTLRELGAVRLRSFAEPERLSQVCHPGLADDFPSIATHTRLPPALTSFVGRDRELKDVTDALRQNQLVTLTGAGGCGKSRLAVEAARGLEAFVGRVMFVDLSVVADPAEVAKEVAAAVGIRVSTLPVEQQLEDEFGGEPALLILDNCEHLIDAIAALCADLMRDCPNLTLMTTSREPLGVPGEVVLRVPSLDTDDAGQLFVDRARLARPDFALTPSASQTLTEICARLDGIPLAVELAASRVNAFSLDDIAAGLEDRFALLSSGGRTALSRQRTLEASVEWSYDLLGDDERALLRRLAVFVGTFSLDAVQATAQTDNVVSLLGSLVAKSLVLPVDVLDLPRYRLLDTIRYYALRKLIDHDELDEALDDHMAYYRQLGPGLFIASWNADQRRAAATSSAEYANIRAAADRFAAHGDYTGALAVIQPLFLAALDPVRADGPWVSDLLERAEDAPADLKFWACAYVVAIYWNTGDWIALFAFLRATRALRATASLPSSRALNACFEGLRRILVDIAGARRQLAEAEPLVADEPGMLALVAYFVGLIETGFGDVTKAAIAFNRSVEVASEHGCELLHAMALGASAHGLVWTGNLEAAGRRVAEIAYLEMLRPLLNGFESLSLDLAQARGDVALAESIHAEMVRGVQDNARTGPAVAHAAVRLALWRGDVTAAMAHVAAANEANFVFEIRPLGLFDAVEACLLSGDDEAARAVIERHEAAVGWVIPEGGGQKFAADMAAARARLALAQGDAVTAAQHSREALVAFDAAGYRLAVPEVLRVLGLALFESGDAVRGVRLAGASEGVRASIGAVAAPWRVPVDHLREQFSDEWHAGAAMSYEDAVAYAQRGRGERRRPTSGWDSLTPTEHQVVELVTTGMTNKQISDRLLMSVATVKSHLTHVYAKLGVTSRGELAAAANSR